MSILRTIFNATAREVLLDQFGDDTVDVAYVFGDVCRRGLKGVLRHIAKEVRFDRHGDELKMTTAQIVLRYDQFSVCGGLADPQLHGQFMIKRRHEATPTYWAIDDQEGRGVSMLDESFIVVHLVQIDALSRSFPDFYER